MIPSGINKMFIRIDNARAQLACQSTPGKDNRVTGPRGVAQTYHSCVFRNTINLPGKMTMTPLGVLSIIRSPRGVSY